MRDTSPRTYLSSFYSENTPENCYLSFVFSYLSSIFGVFLILLSSSFDYFFFIYTLCAPLPVISIPESG